MTYYDGGEPRNHSEGHCSQGWLGLYGLPPTNGLPESDLPAAEHELAQIGRRDTDPATEFDFLRRIVRAAAIASVSEAEFVRRLRTPRVMLRPRFSAGDSSVAGFSLRDPRTTLLRPEVSDAQLGGDCLLHELRLEWNSSEQARLEAAAEWRQVRILGRWERESILLTSVAMWQRALVDAAQFNDRLRQIDVADRHCWRWAASRVAGVLAIWSLRAEPPSGGPLATASEQLARSAPAAGSCRPPRAVAPAANLARTAYVLAQQSCTAHDPAREALLLGQLSASAILIAKAHRGRGELPAAIRVAERAVSPLAQVERLMHERIDPLPPDDDDMAGR
ncbi:hypothetical protein [Nocardia abscessus]|uniref:hypothetical protein n=1 Tax=Nocardia abscessus TaxID=120957 RepID=UPI0024554793|nr:hypothetical protein [Nocardia abscessus]